jgi:hypothetical protein
VRPRYTNNPNEKRPFVQREGKPLDVGAMQKLLARIGRDAKRSSREMCFGWAERRARAVNQNGLGVEAYSLQKDDSGLLSRSGR